MDDCGSPARLKSLDTLKGTIITAIVCVHLLIARDSGDSGDPSLFLQYFYLGLMFFFICSGYFYRPERSFARNIRGRLVQLLLSLCICGVVLSVVLFLEASILWEMPSGEDFLYALGRAFCLHDIGQPIADNMICPVSGASMGYYYIWTMFWSFMIFYSVITFVDDDDRKTICAILILLAIQALFVEFLAIQVPFYFNLSPFGAALMFAGRLLAKRSAFNRIESYPRKDPKFWLFLAVCAVSALILVIVFQPGIIWDKMYYGEYGWASVFPFYIEAILVTFVLVYLAMLFARIPLVSKVLLLAGRHSLGLLLLHCFVAKFILLLFNEPVTYTWFPPTDTPVTVAVVLLMYAITLT